MTWWQWTLIFCFFLLLFLSLSWFLYHLYKTINTLSRPPMFSESLVNNHQQPISSNNVSIPIPMYRVDHIKTFCINLRSQTRRRDFVEKVFRPHSFLSIDFFPAIDTTGPLWTNYLSWLTPEAKSQLEKTIQSGRREQHADLSPGAIGCFLSHIQCWKTFMTPKYHSSSALFILEDDTYPTPAFSQRFHQIRTHLPLDTDIFLFHSYVYPSPCSTSTPYFQFNDGLMIYRMTTPCRFFLLNAYLITRKGIRKLLYYFEKECASKISVQLDSWLSDLIETLPLTIYFVNEPLCPQIPITQTSIQVYPV